MAEGRTQLEAFPIIYTRYVKLKKSFVSFQENERRLEQERQAKKDYHLHHEVRPTIDEIRRSIDRMQLDNRQADLELTDSLKPYKMRKV